MRWYGDLKKKLQEGPCCKHVRSAVLRKRRENRGSGRLLKVVGQRVLMTQPHSPLQISYRCALLVGKNSVSSSKRARRELQVARDPEH